MSGDNKSQGGCCGGSSNKSTEQKPNTGCCGGEAKAGEAKSQPKSGSCCQQLCGREELFVALLVSSF